MLVTPSGKTVKARLVQFWNAPLPMLDKPEGSAVSPRLVQF